MQLSTTSIVPQQPEKRLAAIQHDYHDLIRLFAQCFSATYRTVLVRGDDEPIYRVADENCDVNQVVFAHGYYASALHEIAHWCIAGDARRKLEDYGYWYCPDGRDAEQQAEFEKVEVKPQALEWAFCLAAGARFQVSTDNLNGIEPDREGFTEKVKLQLIRYWQQGFPPRAQQFIDALAQHYQTEFETEIVTQVVRQGETL